MNPAMSDTDVLSDFFRGNVSVLKHVENYLGKIILYEFFQKNLWLLPLNIIFALITIQSIHHYLQYSRNADVAYCQVFDNLCFLW